MKYTKHERINIGQQIYNWEITCVQAAEVYDISIQSAKRCLRQYRIAYVFPPKREKGEDPISVKQIACTINTLEDHECMTKEELIQEIIRAKINEGRAKKEYAVKEEGAQKEYILRDSRNTKS